MVLNLHRQTSEIRPNLVISRLSIRRLIRSASALDMPVLTMLRQLSFLEASSSRQVQLISHSLRVLLTLFNYVLWFPCFRKATIIKQRNARFPYKPHDQST